MRLDKFLVGALVEMRKTIRIFIKEGLIGVNGDIILDPVWEVDINLDIVTYRGEVVVYSDSIYYMFNKPAGCITARKDIKHRTVLDYIDKNNKNGIFPVGRLDKDTEGLIFLTNDGKFEHQLMHPLYKVEKTYFFWAYGTLTEVKKEKLESGLIIGTDEIPTKPAKLKIDKAGTYEDFRHEIVLHKPPNGKPGCYQQLVVSGYLSISEGRKHQVKRMLKEVGCHVVYLKRIAIGSVLLDSKLEKGKYRSLTKEELTQLKKR